MRPAPSPSARMCYILFCVSLLAVAVIAYATVHGPWAFSDSVAYVVSALNLAQGRGLGLVQASGDFVPLVHYPPLYPLILSATVLFHIDALDAARWLNAILFGVLVWVVGSLAHRCARSTWLTFLALGILLSSPALIYIYCGAMSEPLFILLIMACLAALADSLVLRSGHRLGLAGCLAGLAALTRYTGVAAIAAGLVAIVTLSEAGLRQRLTRATTFLLGGLTPVIVWVLVTRRLRGASPIRALAIPVEDVWQASQPLRADLADTLWRMLPYSPQLPRPPYWFIHALWIAALASILALGTAAILKAQRRRAAAATHYLNPGMLAYLLSWFVLVYIGTISLAYLFTSPTPDVDERMLSPILIPAWLSGLSVVLVVEQWCPRPKLLRAVVTAIVLGGVLYTAPAAGWTIRKLHAEGAGYTSLAWRRSETVAAVRRIAPDVPLITNESSAVLLLTGRPAYDIPQFLESTPRDSFCRFGDDLTDPTETVFRESGAALVIFGTAEDQLGNTFGSEASLRLAELTQGLVVLNRDRDGTIYLYPEDALDP